jgi:hypothetical protein
MAQETPCVEEVLTELFSTHWIEQQARALGVVQRMRKIHPSAFFWTLGVDRSGVLRLSAV